MAFPLLILLISFSLTYLTIPRAIQKLSEKEIVVLDMYKNNKPKIPTNAGLVIIFTSYLTLSLTPLLIRVLNLTPFSDFDLQDLQQTDLAFLLVVAIFSFYGVLDDLVDIGRTPKLLLPILFSYPLIISSSPDSLSIPFFDDVDLTSSLFGNPQSTDHYITLSDLFKVIIIPVYVMVVSNLVNMHSGYNGLQSGLSIIILSTLLVKSYYDGIFTNIFPAVAFLGGMLAFWLYNRFPAQIFEGNIGSLMFGSVIGCVVVLQEYWWFAFWILLPHTFNFILWFIWIYLMKKDPEVYLIDGVNHQKFGKIDSDGIITVPNRLTLKWIPNYYFSLTELQSTNIMYSITIIFCLSGLFLF